MWGDIAIAFLLGCITSFVITPYTIKFAKKVDAVDKPKEERRINTTPTPRLRRISCYKWFHSFDDLFSNGYEFRRNYISFWGRKQWSEIIGLPRWYCCSCNYMLY